MADRQYGIPTGYREGDDRQRMQPIEAYNAMQAQQYRHYPPSAQTATQRSPPRRPVAPYERKAVPVPPSSKPPPPPAHQDGYSQYGHQSYQSSTTPDEDSYGPRAFGGGLAGVATTVADDHPRESGMQALRDIDHHYGSRNYEPEPQYSSYASSEHRSVHQPANSQSSIAPLAPHAAAMAHQPSFDARSAHTLGVGYGYGYDQSMPGARPYRGDGYDEYVNPQDIADDPDDAFDERPNQGRGRFGAAAVAGATVGAGAGMRNAFGARDASGNYGPVPGNGHNGDAEKSEWLKGQSTGRKRWKWIVGIIAILVVAGIVAGVLGSILPGKFSSGSGSTSSHNSGGPISNGNNYDINSPQVQALLNNKDLHKVFPGMDYTPQNAQYPGCLTEPPDQNHVTLDVAVMSQLTPAIRLYGTDCGQTEMVLTAIDKLGYNDTLKVWIGVWLATNTTTNNRQLNQMYDILDTYPQSHFAGVIVGNEVLFREDMTVTQLGEQLADVRNKLSAKGINLPVATSDLGDDWTAALAEQSDIVMSNVHPFFAGTPADQAAAWTWNFWQTHDVILTGASKGAYPNNIIAETGWPSQGGNDCGDGAKCPTSTQGSIAGIDEMNTFMEGWVCDSLANGTTYFWFEAFDEPWKVIFNTPSTGDFWEPHWGLMDVDRNLKSGLKIPDCGGKTIDKPY